MPKTTTKTAILPTGQERTVIDNILLLFKNSKIELDEASRLLGNISTEGKDLFVDYVRYNTNIVDAPTTKGVVSWNSEFGTTNIPTGLGPVIQVGQEFVFLVENNTGVDIADGKVCSVSGLGTVPSISLAKADFFSNCDGSLLITTMLISAGERGYATLIGRVTDVDLGSLPSGSPLYLSSTEWGGLSSTKPEFPAYTLAVGGVLKAGANGTIGVNFTGAVSDTFNNFYNGTIRESFNFRILSDGATVTGTLRDGQEFLTMIFSDGFSLLDIEPPIDITLTPGMDTNPQTNYVYIPLSTKLLTISISDWPVEEHIKIALVAIQSAASVKAEGAMRNQNYNDHLTETAVKQGHLSHIAAKLRKFESQWESGVEGSSDITANVVTLQNTAGVIFQMHEQTFQLKDTRQYAIDAVSIGNSTFTISDDGDLSSTFTDNRVIKVNGSTGNDTVYTIVSTSYNAPDFIITVSETIADATADGTIGDDASVINDSIAPYTNVSDLTDITLDASGVTLNNTSFSLVVWGIMNKSGEVSHLMINLPTTSYNKNFPSQAVEDAFNYSVYSIPKQYQGVGFLIARHTYVDNGGVWSLYETEDLRGRVPNTTAGGGGGGTGVTSFTGLTDTPSAHVADNFLVCNASGTALEYITLAQMKTLLGI